MNKREGRKKKADSNRKQEKDRRAMTDQIQGEKESSTQLTQISNNLLLN